MCRFFQRASIVQHVFECILLFQRVKVFPCVPDFERFPVFQRLLVFEHVPLFLPACASLQFIRHDGTTNTGSRLTRAINPD